jgi:alanine racemase
LTAATPASAISPKPPGSTIPASETARLTRLEVDLAAIVVNWRFFGRAQPHAECAAVVKADGYGMGAAAVARALAAAGARSFFVATLGEGLALRAALGAGPAIYVLGGVEANESAPCAAAQLIPAHSRPDQIAAWAGRAPFALQLDVGMHRLGLTPEDARALPDDLQPALVIGHLACASDHESRFNLHQRALFEDLTQGRFPGTRRSLAASAGALLGPDFGYDLIRPGIGLYGGGFLDQNGPPLVTVATLTAPVLQTRPIAAGATVGYGATFSAPRAGHIATIGAGYADGVLRSLGGKGYAATHGRVFAFAGRVSMDMITLWDETGALRPGDRVELIGPSVPLDDVAARAGTIAYEVLTQLAHTPRTYIGGV